jgi:hypothetical protein
MVTGADVNFEHWSYHCATLHDSLNKSFILSDYGPRFSLNWHRSVWLHFLLRPRNKSGLLSARSHRAQSPELLRKSSKSIRRRSHPEQPGRLAARLHADQIAAFWWRHVDRETTFKMFIFKLKWKTNIIGQNRPQFHRKQCCLTVSICHMLKIDLKTLENNWNWKNYLADSRFVPRIDLLTFPPKGGTFFRIQDGIKPMSLSHKKHLRDENAWRRSVNGAQSERP